MQENRELVDDAYKKLRVLITDLKEEQKRKSDGNVGELEEIPDELKVSYISMQNGEMDEKAVDNFEKILIQRRRENLINIKSAFEAIQNKKIEEELKEFARIHFSDIPENEIKQEIKHIMLDSKVDKDGRLVLPKHSIFSQLLFNENGEVIKEQSSLVDKLSLYAETPKISSLSNQELFRLARNCRNLEGLNLESKEYKIAKFIKGNPGMLPENIEEIMDRIDFNADEYRLINDLSEEAALTHKIMVAEELQGQFSFIRNIVSEYDFKEKNDGEINKSDAKNRAIALKIARKKVNALENTGLSKLISDDDKRKKSIIRGARGVLLKKLEKVRDAGTKRLVKEFGSSESKETSEGPTPEEVDSPEDLEL